MSFLYVIYISRVFTAYGGTNKCRTDRFECKSIRDRVDDDDDDDEENDHHPKRW